MSKLSRVTVTLPAELLAATDARAEQLDRSRSWVVAEALRAHVARADVDERVAAYGAGAFAEARRRQLASDLRLGPAERLHRAEELRRLSKATRLRGRRSQVIGFDSYEDFCEWKKTHRAGL